MKILFVYFNRKQMCGSAEEAIEFINGLHYRNQEKQPKLEVNENTLRILRGAYASEWQTNENGIDVLYIKDPTYYKTVRDIYRNLNIKTTNCRETSIYGYRPHGETIEEHDAYIAARDLAMKTAREERERAELDHIMAEMSKTREGWYHVMITCNCYKWNERRCEHQWVEQTFSGDCIATSKLNAFSKACADIVKNTDPFDGQGFQFPQAWDEGSVYVDFLGVKTDEGYSVEKWEEWKANGEI